MMVNQAFSKVYFVYDVIYVGVCVITLLWWVNYMYAAQTVDGTGVKKFVFVKLLYEIQRKHNLGSLCFLAIALNYHISSVMTDLNRTDLNVFVCLEI